MQMPATHASWHCWGQTPNEPQPSPGTLQGHSCVPGYEVAGCWVPRSPPDASLWEEDGGPRQRHTPLGPLGRRDPAAVEPPTLVASLPPPPGERLRAPETASRRRGAPAPSPHCSRPRRRSQLGRPSRPRSRAHGLCIPFVSARPWWG